MMNINNESLIMLKIYPGVIETLNALKEAGCKIAICTSKDMARVKHVLASLMLDGEKFQTLIVCVPKKQGLRTNRHLINYYIL